MNSKTKAITTAREARDQAYDSYNKAFDQAERQFDATIRTAESVHRAGMDAVNACIKADEADGEYNDYTEQIDKYNRGLVSTCSAARRSFEATVDKLLVRYDDVRRESTD